MITLKEYIKGCVDLIKNEKFRHYFVLYTLIFISSSIISIVIGLRNIDLSERVIFLVKNYTSFRYANGDMISILANNFLISILIMFYFYLEGLKLKKYFGIFYFSYMGVITGMAISIVVLKYNLIIALSMIVPHGIIEIPTIVYAASSGWILSELNKSKGLKIPREFIFISMNMFILLGISAYIESNITPYIYNTIISYYY